MKKSARCYARLSYVATLMGILALCTALPAHATREQAVRVTTFYSTSAQSYANWQAANFAPPPLQTTFASGTTRVAFFIGYAGAGHYRFLILLRTQQGASVKVTPGWQGAPSSPVIMAILIAAVGAFPNGAYQAELLNNGLSLATVDLHIGGAGVPSAPSAGVHGVIISAFRASTVAAVNAWVAQTGFYPLPIRTTIFPAGTTKIGFTFLFKGAIPQVTAEQIVAHGPNGLILRNGRPFVVQRSSDGIYNYISGPQHRAYPNGHYTAVVLINGQPSAQTTFSVG